MQPRTTITSRISVITALLALVVGCGISPKPEPPSAEPTLPVIDPVQIVSQEPTDGPPEPTIVGGPGAVEPPDGIVRATNLDDTGDPLDAVIQADGSFALWLDLFAGDEIRLQVITDAVRSEPFDFVVVSGKGALPAPRPLADCLILAPAAQIDITKSLQVVVTNRCPFDVSVNAPLVRRPASGWIAGAGALWPSLLAPAAKVTIAMQAPAGVDDAEEVIFIEAVGPQTDRRPITAFRDAP